VGACANSQCQWVGPSSNPAANYPGNYFYYFETTFQIASRADIDTAVLTLSIAAADTVVSILINGVDTSTLPGVVDPNKNAFTTVGADSYTSFNFQNTDGIFRKGTNTLELVVEHRYGSPVALEVNVVSADSGFTTLEYPTPADGLYTCDQFNVYLPGTPLPAGYEDLSHILPNIVLDAEGKVTLPCAPTVTDSGYFVPEVLSVVYSYYGEPICAVIVDCNMAGVGQILPTVTNNDRQETLTFVAEELCSNPGVFFGCIDSAFGHKLELSKIGAAGKVVTGEFADTLTIGYTDPYGFSSPSVSIWLVCGNQPHWSFDLISSLMLRDAFNRSIEKLTSLRTKILQVQGLLFNNAQDIPCEEIGQATDLAGTALDFFNFLECLGDRELNEDAFLFNTNTITAELANSTGLCDPIQPLIPYTPPASSLAK